MNLSTGVVWGRITRLVTQFTSRVPNGAALVDSQVHVHI